MISIAHENYITNYLINYNLQIYAQFFVWKILYYNIYVERS